MSMPDTPGKRPNGWSPTPMMATSALTRLRPPVLGHLGRRAARARVLRGEGDNRARGAAAADQLRIVGRPGEEAFGHRDARHHAPSERARSSSLTTLPVALTGSASRNLTTRGT